MRAAARMSVGSRTGYLVATPNVIAARMRVPLTDRVRLRSRHLARELAREHWGSQNFVSVSANERPLRRSAPRKYGQEVKVHIRCSKIERGERAVDCFSLAIKLHRKLPDAQFLFDEYHEIALKTKAKH
jgi:hypothetical protein